MKRRTTNMLLVSCAALGLATSAAFADCSDEISALQSEGSMTNGADASGGGHGGISKDGSLAPLQDPNAPSGGAATGGEVATTATSGDQPSGDDASTGTGGGEGIAKDGTRAPLEEESTAAGGSETGAGTGSTVAISQQDAQAQQQAASGSSGGTRADALERAQAALDRGDEQACMDAVEEARNL